MGNFFKDADQAMNEAHRHTRRELNEARPVSFGSPSTGVSFTLDDPASLFAGDVVGSLQRSARAFGLDRVYVSCEGCVSFDIGGGSILVALVEDRGAFEVEDVQLRGEAPLEILDELERLEGSRWTDANRLAGAIQDGLSAAQANIGFDESAVGVDDKKKKKEKDNPGGGKVYEDDVTEISAGGRRPGDPAPDVGRFRRSGQPRTVDRLQVGDLLIQPISGGAGENLVRVLTVEPERGVATGIFVDPQDPESSRLGSDRPFGIQDFNLQNMFFAESVQPEREDVMVHPITGAHELQEGDRVTDGFGQIITVGEAREGSGFVKGLSEGGHTVIITDDQFMVGNYGKFVEAETAPVPVSPEMTESLNAIKGRVFPLYDIGMASETGVCIEENIEFILERRQVKGSPYITVEQIGSPGVFTVYDEAVGGVAARGEYVLDGTADKITIKISEVF